MTQTEIPAEAHRLKLAPAAKYNNAETRSNKFNQ